jgi:histidine triad (HIT) family protein
MTKDCKFCRIISGELPASIVLENDFCMAFLDHRPLFPGHCLLVPRKHYETLADLPDNLIQPLFSDARLLSRAVEAGMEAEGTFVAINNKISQSVPHLHIHLVPRRKKDGLKGFFWPRNPYRDAEDMAEVVEKIKGAVRQLS